MESGIETTACACELLYVYVYLFSADVTFLSRGRGRLVAVVAAWVCCKSRIFVVLRKDGVR